MAQMTILVTVVALGLPALAIIVSVWLRIRYGPRRLLGKYQTPILLAWVAFIAVALFLLRR